jgi:hypothetical protein
MGLYRKKPVVIRAQRLMPGRELATRLALWCGGRISEEEDYQAPSIIIPTLEGDHLARPGDWIIEGVQGEFYPCKPDIFEATYEPAEGGA